MPENPLDNYFNSLSADRKISFDHQSAIRRSIMREWVGTNPGEALAQLSAMPYDQQKNLVNSMDGVVQDAERRQGYLDALVTMEESDLRAELIEEVAERYAEIDAEAAIEWFEKLKFGNERLGFKAAAEMSEALYQRDPKMAVDWLWARTPADFQNRFVADFVGKNWMREDRQAASTWLREHGYDPDNLPKPER